MLELNVAPRKVVFLQNVLHPGHAFELGLDAAGANVLCTRHNEALSGPDSTGKTVLSFLRTLPEKLNRADAPSGQSVRGLDVERLLLQVVCGLAASGNARAANCVTPVVEKGWEPPLEWLSVLFGPGRFFAGRGLYVDTGEQQAFRYRRLGFGPVVSDAGEIVGAVLELDGVRFELAMLRPELTATVPSKVHRPRRIVFTNPRLGAPHFLEFSWDMPSRTSVMFEWRDDDGERERLGGQG